MQKNKLKYIKDIDIDKVEVQDLDDLRWIISREAFKKFKNTGLLFVPKELNIKFQNILGGRNYQNLSKEERHKVIRACLEAAVNEPIENIFPDF